MRLHKRAIVGAVLALAMSACSSPPTDANAQPSPAQPNNDYPGPIVAPQASFGTPLGTPFKPEGRVILKDLQVGQTVTISGLSFKVDTNKNCWLPLEEDVRSFGAEVNGSVQITRLQDGYYVSELPSGGFIAWDLPEQMASHKYVPVMNCATPGKAKASGQQIPDRYRIFTAVPDLKTVKEGWVDLPDAYGFKPPVYISPGKCYIYPFAFLNRSPRPSRSFDVAWDGQQYIIKGPNQNTVEWFRSGTTKDINLDTDWLPARCPQ